MELRDHLRILRTHWVGVLVITLLVVVAVAAYDLSRTKIYAADANAFVSTGTSGNGIDNSVNDDLAKSRATSYVVIAKSRATAEQVIEDLGLEGTSASALASQISVEQPTDTVLLHITATDTSPREAQELADAWVTALATQVQELEDPDNRQRPGTPRIVSYGSAELPKTPISPQPVRDLMIAVLVGLLLGYGYALLRHNLDRRVRTPKQVEDLFQVPVLGSVPMAGALSEPAARSQVVLEDGESQERHRESAEAFRKLRTNLIFMQVDHPPRVIVITSPQPGDGKSTVAANLAGAIAFSGQRVVLVDGDLRRPTVATSLQLDEGVGLTDVLVGTIAIDDAVQQSHKHENLFVLPAGRIPPNPSELLGSQSMRHLLKQLGDDYLVIIDAPPLLPVTDAAILTASADGALVVISAGRTLDAELGQALSSLAAVNGRALGVILNKSSRRSAGGGYYYENYGYYGSYGEDRPRLGPFGRRRGRKTVGRRPSSAAVAPGSDA